MHEIEINQLTGWRRVFQLRRLWALLCDKRAVVAIGAHGGEVVGRTRKMFWSLPPIVQIDIERGQGRVPVFPLGTAQPVSFRIGARRVSGQMRLLAKWGRRGLWMISTELASIADRPTLSDVDPLQRLTCRMKDPVGHWPQKMQREWSEGVPVSRSGGDLLEVLLSCESAVTALAPGVRIGGVELSCADGAGSAQGVVVELELLSVALNGSLLSGADSLTGEARRPVIATFAVVSTGAAQITFLRRIANGNASVAA